MSIALPTTSPPPAGVNCDWGTDADWKVAGVHVSIAGVLSLGT